MRPRETLEHFDHFLARLGLSLDAVVLGGAALALLGVVSRPTRDCDVLHPELPIAIRDAARAFAIERRALGDALDDDWLNDAPSSLGRVLPDGWLTRVQEVFRGRAIVLRSLGRVELLMSKLFALCDRSIDLQDCIALAPTVEELREILPWLVQQDANPEWPTHVQATISDLQQRLSHGL